MINSTTTCSGTYDAGITAQTCATAYAQSTSTDPTVYNGFTAGEIVIVVMIFIQIALVSVLTYHLLFRRVKIKNQ